MPASPQIVPVDLEATLQAQGFAFVEGSAMRPWLERAGALDDPQAVEPASTIWASSAPRWACIDADLPQFPKMPPPA